MEGNEEMVEVWLRTVAGQGIALAFLIAFLFLFLYACIALTRHLIVALPQLTNWIIAFFKQSIETQQALVENNNRLINLAEQDRRDVRTVVRGNRHMANGLHALVEGHGERLGIGSDVLVHLENAKKEFDGREEIERQWRYRDEQRRERERRGGTDNGTE